MKCAIPGRCIRAFAKAIQCLSKIGDELYLEATSDGLAMKTVNPARSAYSCFTFRKVFFHAYQDGRDASNTETLKCKITVKSCLSVFRALPTLEKTVDHCTLTLNQEDNKLVFVFYCKHGIIKTHNLGFQECDALQAVYSKDLCPNRIVSNSKVLSDVVSNFPSNLEEVTLITEPDKARLRSYTEDDSEDNTRVAVSEISLVAAEFDDYRIGIDASITFCLKELRAILLFTEAINHALSLRFETAGRPVVVSIDDCPEYQADFVLATLLDAQDPTPSHKHTTTSTPCPRQTEAGASHHHTAAAAEPSFVDDEEEEPRMPLAEPKRMATRGTGGRDNGSKINVPFPSDPMRRVNMPEPPLGVVSRLAIPSPPLEAPSRINVPSPPDPLLLNNCEMLADESVDEGVAPGHEALGAGQDGTDLTDALFEMEGRTDSCETTTFWGVPCGEEGPQPKRIVEENWGGASDILDHRKPKEMQAAAETDRGGSEQDKEPEVAKDTVTRDLDNSTAEDSLVNQSGIIPGTPPAKKYKSLLFGMDVFLPNHNTSEVLAPDSDEDD